MNLNELREALNKVSDQSMLKNFHFWHDLCTDEGGEGKVTLMYECDDEEEDACRALLSAPEMRPLIEFGKELNKVFERRNPTNLSCGLASCCPSGQTKTKGL